MIYTNRPSSRAAAAANPTTTDLRGDVAVLVPRVRAARANATSDAPIHSAARRGSPTGLPGAVAAGRAPRLRGTCHPVLTATSGQERGHRPKITAVKSTLPLVLAVVGVACSGASTAGSDAGVLDGAGADAFDGVLDALRCVTELEQQQSVPAWPLCQQTRTFRPPRTIIDLRGTEQARCDNWVSNYQEPNYAHVLPSSPDAYPVILRVGTSGFVGPCSRCNREDDNTTYGVAFTVLPEAVDPPGLDASHDRTLIVRAPAPWFLTAGGTGKASPYPCAGGYQEFNTPRACLWSYSRGYGVVTTATDPPDADIWVDLVLLSELEGQSASCCPYGCD